MESEVVPFYINQSIDRSAYYFIIKSTPSVINLAVLESVPVQGNRLMCPQFLREMLKSFSITTIEGTSTPASPDFFHTTTDTTPIRQHQISKSDRRTHIGFKSRKWGCITYGMIEGSRDWRDLRCPQR